MTAVLVSMRLEFEAIGDATSDLASALDALSRRHGARFRALERRILALQEDPGKPGLFPVEGGLIVTAPAEWTEILKEARGLGVI